eukprot:scaffold89361_cov63-Phaeocystis_antarctica.AAC.1
MSSHCSSLLGSGSVQRSGRMTIDLAWARLRTVESGREEDDEHFTPREARANLGQEVLPVVAHWNAQAGGTRDTGVVQRMRYGHCLEHAWPRTLRVLVALACCVRDADLGEPVCPRPVHQRLNHPLGVIRLLRRDSRRVHRQERRGDWLDLDRGRGHYLVVTAPRGRRRYLFVALLIVSRGRKCHLSPDIIVLLPQDWLSLEIDRRRPEPAQLGPELARLGLRRLQLALRVGERRVGGEPLGAAHLHLLGLLV